MAMNGSEPIIAMGNDAPLAAMSTMHQPLFNYFLSSYLPRSLTLLSILFVKIVTSTSLDIGTEGNILNDSPDNCRLLLHIHNLFLRIQIFLS